MTLLQGPIFSPLQLPWVAGLNLTVFCCLIFFYSITAVWGSSSLPFQSCLLFMNLRRLWNVITQPRGLYQAEWGESMHLGWIAFPPNAARISLIGGLAGFLSCACVCEFVWAERDHGSSARSKCTTPGSWNQYLKRVRVSHLYVPLEWLLALKGKRNCMAITSFKGSLECVIVLAVAPSGVYCHKILETNMHSCHESGGRHQGH